MFFLFIRVEPIKNNQHFTYCINPTKIGSCNMLVGLGRQIPYATDNKDCCVIVVFMVFEMKEFVLGVTVI